MELLGLWMAAVGCLIVFAGSLPPFIARYPPVAAWMNCAGSALGTAGAIIAIFAYHPRAEAPAASSMMAAMPPDSEERLRIFVRRSLFMGFAGSVFACIAGSVAYIRGTHEVGVIVAVLGAISAARAAATLASGPPASMSGGAL